MLFSHLLYICEYDYSQTYKTYNYKTVVLKHRVRLQTIKSAKIIIYKSNSKMRSIV